MKTNYITIKLQILSIFFLLNLATTALFPQEQPRITLTTDRSDIQQWERVTLKATLLNFQDPNAYYIFTINNKQIYSDNLSGQMGYSRLNDGVVNMIPGLEQNYLTDQVLFAASWEIVFWGKYRRGIESDRASYLGTSRVTTTHW